MTKYLTALALACWLAVPSPLGAQATDPVPLQHWSYDDLDNALGPRGSAVVLEGTARSRSGTMASLRIASESRRNDQYAMSWDPVTRDNYRLWKTVDLPTELRDCVSLQVKQPMPGGWGHTMLDLGVEGVRNSGFEAGSRRTNPMLALSLMRSFR